jgi:NAD(P)H-dependent FMN reductase
MLSSNENPEVPITVVALCGSLRRGSYTRRALDVALQGAQEVGARTKLIDLREYRLGFCGEEDGGGGLDDVLRLRREVRDAQGILLGTPEYHGGYSGVLKNALDLMGFEEIDGKMIGLVGVGAGAMGAANALSGLRTIARALHAWVIPEQASIPESHKAFGEAGVLNDQALERRLKTVGRQVARFAYLHSSTRAQELLKDWEQFYSPVLEG